MKFFFSAFLIFFLTKPLLSNNFETTYEVSTKGIIIGSLTWSLDVKDKRYVTFINLKNKGFISKLYAFEGEYRSMGIIKNSFLLSEKYNQFWKTKKKEGRVEITYKNMGIEKIVITPKEKELPRIDLKKLRNYNDPITSFLNIIFNQGPVYTIDGRRTYLLYPIKKEGFSKILIEEYKNIWADHKRNDLEYLEIFMKKGEVLPDQIKVMFKGSIFTLKKI